MMQYASIIALKSLNMIPRYARFNRPGRAKYRELGKGHSEEPVFSQLIYAYMYSGVKAETVFRTQLLGELLVDLQAGKKP